MRSLRLTRHFALSAAASASLLAGCGGTQPLSIVPGAMPQTTAVSARPDLGRSWMLPETASEDLLYAATRKAIEIYSYPAGKHVGELSAYYPGGLCSDPNGDVFVDDGETITEYAHGATKPTAKIKSKFGSALQCAYDPTTGNLAVIDTYFTGPENVAIYKNVTGSGQEYSDYGPFYSFVGCAYDDSGNLFVTGYTGTLGELPSGASSFINYTPSLKTANSVLTGVQWDGKYLAVQELPAGKDHALLDQITIANKKAKVVSRTKLSGQHIGFRSLFDGVAIGFEGQNRRTIAAWNYPAGGSPVALERSRRTFYAVTISAAP